MRIRFCAYLCVLLVLAAGPNRPARCGEPSSEAPQVPEEQVQKGLRYLAKQQSKDGSWGKINTVAITSCACMALMASGSSWGRGPYGDQVQKALEYLMRCQEPHGCILQRSNMSWAETHSHGYALLCLAQAYGMVPEEERDHMAVVIRKGIKAALSSQSDNGGWGYGILQKNALNGMKDEGSCSITQLQALRACRDLKFEVPEKNVRDAIAYVEKCFHKPTGGYVYSLSNAMVGLNGGEPTFAVSAAMVSSLNAAGDYHSNLEAKSIAYLHKLIDRKADEALFHGYGHFYASQAFFQAGEEEWRYYWAAVMPKVLKLQREDGSFIGQGNWGMDEQYGGTLLDTSFYLLVLQIPNQYLPIFQR